MRETPRRMESEEESPEMQAHLQTIDRIELMPNEEFESASEAAKLTEPEKAAMTHMRATSEWLKRFDRQDEVRHLYFAAKHPTLSRIFSKLNIALDNPYDSKELDKLDEQEKQFSLFDYDQAIEKI